MMKSGIPDEPSRKQAEPRDEKPAQIAGWICLILGMLVSMGAVMWLLTLLIIEPTLSFFVPGLIQLGIGLMLVAAIWVVPSPRQPNFVLIAIVLLGVNMVFGCWLVMNSQPNSKPLNDPSKAMSVIDLDSRIQLAVGNSVNGYRMNRFC